MTPTITQMQTWFDEFNKQVFNDTLPNVKITFTNRKYPEDDFEKSFSAYADYPSEQSLDQVEAELCEQIVEQLCEDILNATVANW